MAKWFGVPYFSMAPLGLLFALAFKTKINTSKYEGTVENSFWWNIDYSFIFSGVCHVCVHCNGLL